MVRTEIAEGILQLVDEFYQFRVHGEEVGMGERATLSFENMRAATPSPLRRDGGKTCLVLLSFHGAASPFATLPGFLFTVNLNSQLRLCTTWAHLQTVNC